MYLQLDVLLCRMQLLINNVDAIQEGMNQKTAPILNDLSAPMTNMMEVQPSSPELKIPVQLDTRLTSLEQQVKINYLLIIFLTQTTFVNSLEKEKTPQIE